MLLDDDLLVLALFEDTFLLVRVEVLRESEKPLGGFLTDVADDYRFFCHVLHRTIAEVQQVGEVDHRALADSEDWHHELLALSHHD